MRFNPKKFRLQYFWNKSKKNINELDIKSNSFDYPTIDNTTLKTSKVLYDSGELVSNWSDGSIVVPPVWLSSQGYSVREGESVLLNANYSFDVELNVPDHLLPFLRSVATIRTVNPDTVVKGVVSKGVNYEWWNNYVEVKGDSTLLFRGTGLGNEHSVYGLNPPNNSDWYIKYTSNAYRGSIETLSGGSTYRMTNGQVRTAISHYNLTYTTHDGVTSPNPNMDIFEAPALDSLSTSTFSGTGTVSHIQWTGVTQPDLSVTWSSSTTIISKNTTKSGMSLTEIIIYGSIYINNSYFSTQQWLFTVADKTSFTVWRQIVNYGTSEEYGVHAYYSSKRARQLFFTGVNILDGLPDTNDYQTSTLPYTKLYVDVNPDGKPIAEFPYIRGRGRDGVFSYQQKLIWVKINHNIDKFTTTLSGTFPLQTPAKYNNGDTVINVDEQYSHSGSTYLRDIENRGNKDVNRFVAERQEVYIRVQIICTNPIYNDQLRRYIN